MFLKELFEKVNLKKITDDEKIVKIFQHAKSELATFMLTSAHVQRIKCTWASTPESHSNLKFCNN